MRESTFYQAIFEEGRQEGRQQERFSLLRKIVPLLQGWGMPIEPILKIAGVTLAELELGEGSSEDDPAAM